LTSLDLNSNNIFDEGGKAIANALTKNSSLTTLDLRYNNISDEGVQAIANALTKNSSLTTLDLNNNSISEEGVRALISVIPSSPSIKNIYVYGNPKISEDVKKALHRMITISNSKLVQCVVLLLSVRNVEGNFSNSFRTIPIHLIREMYECLFDLRIDF
jgi:Ran GTPase-activating protein (RanGAP) involved in mRNA processing and transport